MSKFLKGIKGNEKKEVTSFDADAIAEKLHSVGTTKAATIVAVPTVEEVAETPKPAAKKATPRKTARQAVPKDQLHRLTLDIPKDVMEQMVKDTQRRGQTIKGFIVSLIYDFYEKAQ
jgi:hypothetical protein